MNLYYLSKLDFNPGNLVNSDYGVFWCYKSIEDAMEDTTDSINKEQMNLYQINSIGALKNIGGHQISVSKMKITKKITARELITDFEKYKTVELNKQLGFILNVKNITEDEIMDLYSKIRYKFSLSELKCFFANNEVSANILNKILNEILKNNHPLYVLKYFIINPNVDENFLKYIIEIMISQKYNVIYFCKNKKISEEIYMMIISTANNVDEVYELLDCKIISQKSLLEIVLKLKILVPDCFEKSYCNSRIYDILEEILKKYNDISKQTLIIMLEISEYLDEKSRITMIKQIINNQNFSFDVFFETHKIIKPNISNELFEKLLIRLNINSDVLSSEADATNTKCLLNLEEKRNNIIKEINQRIDIKLFEHLMLLDDLNLKESIDSQSKDSELPKLDYKLEKSRLLNKYLQDFSFISIRALVIKEMMKLGILTKEKIFDCSFINDCNRKMKICDIFTENLQDIDNPKQSRIQTKRRGV